MLKQNQKQQEIFKKYYVQLNPQQKQAVDTLDGPVIVNAGPGTGKTQILATRIGNILLNTDTDPSNILCLTYTDNGVVEMRNRLLKIVGTAAYNIAIHTYHSFCNEVIQDNKSMFGMYSLEPISELEEAEIFKTLINNIDKDSPLKRYSGNVYYEETRLKSLFALMKKEALSAEYFNERIDTHLQELPTKEGFYYKKNSKVNKKGDPNMRLINVETERMELLRAAILLFPTYNKMMQAAHRYTFDDMILWVLEAFEKDKNFLLNYQERYLYFLIDEFQDTSRSQNLLIHHLTSYWDEPNIFVVGDADQSIFSFQDANVENIIHFEKKYKDAITKIDLIDNYRSTQTILDTAFALISHNKLRTVQPQNNHPLRASNNEINEINIAPRILEYPNPAQESVDIALQIESLLKTGISGNDIAVIYKNHNHVNTIAAILKKKEIAINMRKAENVLSVPIIENLITILNWINQENSISYSGDDLLFQLLHFNFFHCTSNQIAKLNLRVNEKNIGKRENRISLRSELAEMKKEAGTLFEEADNSLKKTSESLEFLLQESHNVTLQYLIELVIQKTGMLFYIMHHTEKPFLMQALNTFYNFLKDSCSKNPDMKLHDFIKMILLMQQDKIALPIYRITSTQNGVHLITAHSSKGSEYKYVFIINAMSDIWDINKSDKNHQYKYPDNLVGNGVETDSLEERRRLFYVAATRAKTHLTISYNQKDEKGKAKTQSTFIAEIVDEQQASIIKKTVPDEVLIDNIGLVFTETAHPKIEVVETAYINEILKKYSLSLTHLNNYLECPLKFYYNCLIKVPYAKSSSLVFGSAIHFALQRLFEKMIKNGNIFPSEEEMATDFSWYLQKNREAFTPEEFERRMEYGIKIIPEYYQTHIHQWHKIVSIEYNIRDVQVDGVPINGKLDKLEFNGNYVTVVDYKTGKYENAKKKLAAPTKNDQIGGDIWRQAVFYKILMDNNKRNSWQTQEVVFEFIEPHKNEYKTEKIVVSPADITSVTQQIKDVWQKIKNHEFHTGCGKPTCNWCKFIKSNKLYSELLAAEEDIMDESLA